MLSSYILLLVHEVLTGLKILADALTDDGGMNLFLYGKNGRIGVYQMQNVMKLINKGVTSMQEEVENFKKIQLPPSNWFKKGQLFADTTILGDAGKSFI